MRVMVGVGVGIRLRVRDSIDFLTALHSGPPGWSVEFIQQQQHSERPRKARELIDGIAALHERLDSELPHVKKK